MNGEIELQPRDRDDMRVPPGRGLGKESTLAEIVGTSEALRSVLASVARVAPTDATVLIGGETGTGKELIARAIHRGSRRASRPFVCVNCAAIPVPLVASELFGHERGAFTGALQRRLGRFELAEGGTIFLDEIGELPAETQIALLRVLQEREFERVGASRPIRADVRVIAASNRDLEAAVAEGSFRADLFYRLNVIPLHLPPLRERRGDIPLLVEHFVRRLAREIGKPIREVQASSLDLLRFHDWPGNIRELRNVIERAVIVAGSETLTIDGRWLRPKSGARTPASPPAPTLAGVEKNLIEEALLATKGRVAGPFGAAVRLGVPSSTLEYKIRNFRIDKTRFRPARRVASG
jgi:formate hydrogenlyase transcriptional activator